MMKLFPHQEISKRFLLDRKRCILADSPRVGKTLPTAAAAMEHLPALIVTPAIVKEVWRSAFEKLGFTGEVQVIKGKKMAETLVTDGITILNYDLLGSIKGLGKYQTVVFDECHRVKNLKAIRTVAALKLMARIPRVYALSGTLIPNRPSELYPILHGLGIYRGSWHDYIYRYCRAFSAPWGLDYSGASNLLELRQIITPHILRREKDEIFTDYQEPVVSLVTFDLPIDQREKQFDADALVDNPNALLAFEGLATIMKEAGLRKVKPAIEFILDKLETGESIVVFAHHKEIVHAIKDEIKKHYGVSVITGETNQNYRADIIKQFQSGVTKCFIGNLQACQEGIDLSVADTVIFVEATWQTSALEQASSRVENITKSGKAPLIYLLTIAKSLDHTILKKILKKKNIISQII